MISRKNIYSLYSLIGWGCNSHNADQNGQNRAPGKRGALEFAHQLSQDFEPPKSKWEGYMKSALKQWEPAPVVGKNKGMPGEMGKVRIHNLTNFFLLFSNGKLFIPKEINTYNDIFSFSGCANSQRSRR